jgi:hypothetical protein
MKTVHLNLAMHPASNADYTPTWGPLLFQPGITQRSFSVKVKGDTADEYDELFGAKISSASNAKVGDDDAVGRIVDDDMPIVQPEPPADEPDQPEPPADQPEADADEQGNGGGGNGGGGNQGGSNGGGNGAGTEQSPDTTVGQHDSGVGEGEQALGAETAVEVGEQSEAGIGIGTWLLALAVGLTLTALVILLVSRRRRQI